MGDAIDGFRAIKTHDKERRARLGVACPVCRKQRPKACASLLLPGHRCRVDGYVDPRPEL